MAGQVYFGNGTYQTWIDAPQSGMKASSVGYASSQTALNGRGFVKRSRASHREFSASWVGSLNSSLGNLQTIKDFADGLYGSGPFYWLDPYAIDQNLMPPHWAAPGLAESDWPLLMSNNAFAPTFFPSNLTTNSYPLKTANYSIAASTSGDRKVTIIIPSGYQLNFGWHTLTVPVTAATEAGVRITPYLRSTGAATTAQNPYSITAGTTTRVSTSTTAGFMAQYDGATYSKVDIYLANGSSTVTANVNIVSMIAQITPTGTVPATGPFITGRGTTSLEFSTSPEIEYYSSKINSGQVGMSASFVEVD